MIIRGVFSMSIIDNLKSLFKRGKDNEEKGIDDLKSGETKVTSSNNLDKSVVSGTKTTEPMVKIKISSDDTEDMTFKKTLRLLKLVMLKKTKKLLRKLMMQRKKLKFLTN